VLFTFAQVDPSTTLKSVMSSMRRDGNEYDPFTRQQSINKNMEIILQIDPDRSSSRDDRNLPELSAISSQRLKDAFEIVSEEQRSTLFLADSPLTVSTTVRGTPSSRLKNHLTEIDHRISDHRENKDITSKISRIARDREHILGISGSIYEGEDVSSISDRSESEASGSVSREEKLELAGNATQATVRETSSTRGEEADQDQFAAWTGKSNVRFSRVSGEDGATVAVALVAIGVIMLLVGPVVIILRILDERRQARKPIASPAIAREDLPPTYEQAVLMDEAPRYSTLDLNYDRTPPPSPTFSSTYAFSNVAT